ncbi:MAG TPA: DUF6644 family protein [Bryobacteraceae bacterium]|jgi:hypothetical protein|nr:DUF6644 family protein [Bryobacteraceae bacterium]
MSVLSICQALEATWIGTQVRETYWGYAAPQIAHLLGMALFGGAVVVDDLRLLGRLRRPAFSELSHQLVPLKWLGFVVVVGSGLALFMSDATRLYRNWAFLVKAALLLLVALNAGVFRAAVYRSVEPLPPSAKVSAGLSLLLWFAIIVTSRLIGFVGPEY